MCFKWVIHKTQCMTSNTPERWSSVVTVFPHIIQVIVTIVINFNERETEGQRERVNMWQCNCGLMRNSERDSGCLCVKQAAWRRPVTLISPYHWDLLPLSLHCQCGKWDCPVWNMQRTKTSQFLSWKMKYSVFSIAIIYTRAGIHMVVENYWPAVGVWVNKKLEAWKEMHVIAV